MFSRNIFIEKPRNVLSGLSVIFWPRQVDTKLTITSLHFKSLLMWMNQDLLREIVPAPYLNLPVPCSLHPSVRISYCCFSVCSYHWYQLASLKYYCMYVLSPIDLLSLWVWTPQRQDFSSVSFTEGNISLAKIKFFASCIGTRFLFSSLRFKLACPHSHKRRFWVFVTRMQVWCL